jgi:uncharacterized protein DUF5069
MSVAKDFRDKTSFPRRGREALGGFFWLARVIDKARATANRTEDGYIYPCPMDRAMFHRWGIAPREFTTVIGEDASDEQIIEWLSNRVTPDRIQVANAWLVRQDDALNRHDAEEGVPGAIAPTLPPREIIRGVVVATLIVLAALLARHLQH